MMNSFDWSVGWCYVCTVLLLLLIVTILLLYEYRKRQKLYTLFAGNLGEFIVVLSEKFEFISSLPQFMSDPLFDNLSKDRPFRDILPPKDWARLKLYFDDIDKHPEMPFMFSYKRDDGTMLWFEMRCQHQRLSMDESRYVCLIKNISNIVEYQHRLEEADTKLKSLLRNTGDFLWKYDFENRQLSLLTPMMDDDYRDVPRSGGVVNVETLMPKDDFALLERVMNECIMKASGQAAYDDKGILLDEHDQLNRLTNENARFGTLKIRCLNSEKNLVWYDFRGHLAPDEEDRIVMKGSARRVETSPEIPFLMKSGVEESLMNSLFNFPNIGIFWLDRNFCILGCNNALAADTGFASTDEVVNKSLKEILSSKYLPYYESMIKDVFDNGTAKSWKGRFDDSEMITIHVVPLLKSLLKSGYTVSRVLCVYMRISC
ncbi:MAG: PAS domain-containing protein [Fibrobacter sp.]|nr:PAS domain-containing protein [Fibrobacter sp.]